MRYGKCWPCDAYASDYFMNFNAQKSQCMIVLPSSRRMLAPLLSGWAFKISGMRMEIVSSYCYLGHIICSSPSDE